MRLQTEYMTVIRGAPRHLAGAPRLVIGAPRLVTGAPSYSEGQQECPPRVWYSPEIDTSKFTLHILSDPPGGFQWLKYILLMLWNATRHLGDGKHIILRQRVQGSVRAVSAVRNTRVFLTEIRVVADVEHVDIVKYCENTCVLQVDIPHTEIHISPDVITKFVWSLATQPSLTQSKFYRVLHIPNAVPILCHVATSNARTFVHTYAV